MIAIAESFSLTKALTLTATPMPPTMRATSPVSPRYIVSWSQKRRRPGWAWVYVVTRWAAGRRSASRSRKALASAPSGSRKRVR